MAVIYRGEIPDKNYTILDFYKNGVVVSWVAKYYDYPKNNPQLRCIFRSNGLLGEIRSCGGGTFAVDVTWGWNDSRCLTTQCKNVREAKSILFLWFKSKGFTLTKAEVNSDWHKGHYRFSGQLNLNPFIFRI